MNGENEADTISHSSSFKDEGSNGEAIKSQKRNRQFKSKRLYKCIEDFDAGAVNEEQFYKNLIKLREEHRNTLKLLETKYYNELRKQTNFQWEGFHQGVGLKEYKKRNDTSTAEKEKMIHDSFDYENKYPIKSSHDFVKDMSYLTNTQFTDKNSVNSDDDTEEDDKEENTVEENESHTTSEEFSTSLYPKRSQNMDMVEHLWQDFSIQDYTTNDNETLESMNLAKRDKQKEWTPSITIPKPFAMTLREARTEKKKTRSMQVLEENLSLKKSAEEAELKKKFRAQPVPATTFLPLYEEIIEKNQRRSQRVRDINKALLKATEKPFTFIRREEMKRRRKEEDRLKMLKKKEKEESKQVFKAQPPPKHGNDLSLADRLIEQDEYRKIRKKLRAADLLAASRLPPSMEARKNLTNAAKSRQKCRKSREPKLLFRPNINVEVPDFDALHWEFEKELRKRKKERQPTVVEPFHLKTAHIPRARSNSLGRANSMENLRHSISERNFGVEKEARKVRPSSARLSSSQDTLPFGITESVRLRDEAVKRSLEVEKQKSNEIRRYRKAKQNREKQLRSQVQIKSMVYDHSSQLKKNSKEKLKTFRESDRGRQEEYERELGEMKRRVEQRPLLFERESQENAKRKAQKKYTQILRDVGVDEHLINSLVNKNSDIINSECDSDISRHSGTDDDHERYSMSDSEHRTSLGDVSEPGD